VPKDKKKKGKDDGVLEDEEVSDLSFILGCKPRHFRPSIWCP